MVKIYNAVDVLEADRIVFLLKENGVPSYYHDSASSVVGYGVSGFGLYGVDVYVDDSDKEKAQSILESVKESDEEIMDVELQPMTRERMHELYRGFSLDPDIFMDMSLYEQKKNYVYNPEKVDALFDMREDEEGSRAFAVMLGDKVIGEVGLRHFDPEKKECELSIHLQNDSVKNLGYGTQAEKLAIRYAFDVLGAESIFAESLVKNTRSQHILEKLGFEYIGEEEGFKQYRLAGQPAKET